MIMIYFQLFLIYLKSSFFYIILIYNCANFYVTNILS